MRSGLTLGVGLAGAGLAAAAGAGTGGGATATASVAARRLAFAARAETRAESGFLTRAGGAARPAAGRGFACAARFAGAGRGLARETSARAAGLDFASFGAGFRLRFRGAGCLTAFGLAAGRAFLPAAARPRAPLPELRPAEDFFDFFACFAGRRADRLFFALVLATLTPPNPDRADRRNAAGRSRWPAMITGSGLARKRCHAPAARPRSSGMPTAGASARPSGSSAGIRGPSDRHIRPTGAGPRPDAYSGRPLSGEAPFSRRYDSHSS